MPYSKADFGTEQQVKYKAAVASSLDTPATNVEIVSITEVRRRAGSVNVETRISARDSTGADKLASALGDGDTLKSNINKQLVAQGLRESTTVAKDSASVPASTPAGSSGGRGVPLNTIIGSVVGFVVMVVIVAASAWWCSRRRKQHSLSAYDVEKVRNHVFELLSV
jgi:hypothetical protein